MQPAAFNQVKLRSFSHYYQKEVIVAVLGLLTPQFMTRTRNSGTQQQHYPEEVNSCNNSNPTNKAYLSSVRSFKTLSRASKIKE